MSDGSNIGISTVAVVIAAVDGIDSIVALGGRIGGVDSFAANGRAEQAKLSIIRIEITDNFFWWFVSIFPREILSAHSRVDILSIDHLRLARNSALMALRKAGSASTS